MIICFSFLCFTRCFSALFSFFQRLDQLGRLGRLYVMTFISFNPTTSCRPSLLSSPESLIHLCLKSQIQFFLKMKLTLLILLLLAPAALAITGGKCRGKGAPANGIYLGYKECGRYGGKSYTQPYCPDDGDSIQCCVISNYPGKS